MDSLTSTDRKTGRRLGLWRAAPTLPAALGSVALMLVVLSWAGEWEPLAMLGWLATGPLLLTRPGERIALWSGRFRRLTAVQRRLLKQSVAAALHRCEIDPSCLDWYVHRSSSVNAYACGRRGIAVTRGLLAELADGRVSPAMTSGVLVHELGHLVSGATRYTLAAQWWAAPWRMASRFVLGVTYGLVGRRQPPRLLAGVVITTVVVAIVQAAQQDRWAVVGVLAALVVFGVSVPLLDAAIRRHCERVADRYAARAGASHDLASALSTMGADTNRPGVLARLVAQHPETDERIESLRAPAVG